MATLDTKRLKHKKKKRIMGFIFAIFLELLTTPIFAYIIHQYLSWLFNLSMGKNPVPQIDLNYLAAWKCIITVPAGRMWWGLLQIVVLFLFVGFLLKPKAKIEEIREISITDTIKIPCPAGTGQFGSSWFMTLEEEKKAFGTFVFDGNADTIPKIRPGIVIDMTRKRGREYIRFANSPASSIILGSTGSGKTRRLLLILMWLQMLYGMSIAVSDVKGELYHYTHKFAKKCGYKNIFTFDLRYPRKSIRYNFCQPVIDALRVGDKAEAIDATWDMVSALVGEEKGEPIWYNGETASLAASILAVCMESATEEQRMLVTEWVEDYYTYLYDIRPSQEYLDLGCSKQESIKIKSEISNISSNILCGYITPYLKTLEDGNDCIASELTDRLKALIDNYDIEQFKNMANLYYFIGYMGREDENTGKRPLSLYLDTLPDNHPAKTVFLQGQIAADKTRSSFYTSAMGTLRLFVSPNIADMTSKSDFKLEDIGKEKSILYMMIPDEKNTLYPIASLLINQLYASSVKISNEYGGRLPVPLDFDLDEAGNFPKMAILPPLVTAGRSRYMRAHLVLQDYQQLEKNYKEFAGTIKSNCTTKIYLKSDDPKTLEEISKYLGKYTVELTSASESANYSTKEGSGSVSTSSSLTGRDLLAPSEITAIQAPYALVMNSGKGCITKLPDLSQYRLNQIWGLGNEAHNEALIIKQEEERPVRQVGDIPLWGIWNKYKEMIEESANEDRISFLDI